MAVFELMIRPAYKPALAVVGLLLGVTGGLLVWSSMHPARVLSMRLVRYQRWPHGAMVELTNATRKTVQYLSESNDTPGSPVLWLEQTPQGWTNPVGIVRSVMAWNAGSRTAFEVYYVTGSVAPPKVGERLATLTLRDLKPGRSVEFFILLEPGGPAKRVGTASIVPQTALEKKLGAVVSRIKQWCRIKSNLSGQTEVWCPTVLVMPAEKP